MSNFWETQRQVAFQGVVQDAVAIARSNFERRATAKAHANALQRARETGCYPVEYQNLRPEDDFLGERALMNVVLAQLEQYCPNHPLVRSQECRKLVREIAIYRFNKDGRPSNFDTTKYCVSGSGLAKLLNEYRHG